MCRGGGHLRVRTEANEVSGGSFLPVPAPTNEIWELALIFLFHWLVEFGDSVEESSISISLTEKGEYYLGDEKVDFKNLSKELKKKKVKNMPVLIYADSKVYYEKVMSIVDVVKNSGFSNVSLLVDKQ